MNDAFRQAAKAGPLRSVLNVLEDNCASSHRGRPHSSTIDMLLTAQVGQLLSVVAWYDNGWGYLNRLAEVATYLAERI